MFKRLISLLLALMLLLSVTACSSHKKNSKSPAPSENRDSITPTDHNTGDTQDDLPPDPPAEPFVFEEIVLADNGSLTAKVAEVSYDDIAGFTMHVFLENKTENEIMFTLEDASVNDVLCDPLWTCMLDAGDKTNEQILFRASDLEERGIVDVTKVGFTMTVYDAEDYTADNLLDETFVIYPKGEAAAVSNLRGVRDTDLVLLQTDNCVMVATGVDFHKDLGYVVNIYLENTTAEALMFSLEENTVNGRECDTFWAAGVPSGKCAYTQIVWLNTALKDAGVTEVEKFSLSLRAYDANDWMADPLIEKTVEFGPF